MTCHKPGTLFIEVRLKDSINERVHGPKLQTDIKQWLVDRHLELRVGTNVQVVSRFSDLVERIEITGHSKTRFYPDETSHLLTENNLEITPYSVFADEELSFLGEEHRDEDDLPLSSQFRITLLPNQRFDNLWGSLVYEEPIGERILFGLIRAIKEQQDSSRSRLGCMNTALLHGPPGSGKTALAQALAQRLSIRLSNLYNRIILLEVKSHDLLSKYFGESSKIVGKLFESILRKAEDSSQLTVVIFDEVESIAGCRLKSSRASDVADTGRVTVQMLRGLDDIRKCSNVIFICTTNFINSVDLAFRDRCFLRVSVNAPTIDCVYEILRSELNSLIQSGKIEVAIMIYDERCESNPTIASQVLGSRPVLKELGSLPSNTLNPWNATLSYIPDLKWANVHWTEFADTAASRLYRVACLARGLSGRTLVDLVGQARVFYTVDDPCELKDLIDALEIVVRKESPRNETHQEQFNAESMAPNRVNRRDEIVDISSVIAQIEGDDLN